MLTTRIREFKLSYQWPVEAYLQKFCSTQRLKSGKCPKHLQPPAFVLHIPRQNEYSPPADIDVWDDAKKQQFQPLYRNDANQQTSNRFSGISSYKATRKSKTLNWHPSGHSAESMTEAELDLYVEAKIKELEAVLEGKTEAGVYACDVTASCFKPNQPQCSWSLNGLESRFSEFCEKNPNMTLAQISGLDNLTYLSEPNTISPLHIEDADLWSINYHWRGAPKLWIFFDSDSLMTYVDAVQRDLNSKPFTTFKIKIDYCHVHCCLRSYILWCFFLLF